MNHSRAHTHTHTHTHFTSLPYPALTTLPSAVCAAKRPCHSHLPPVPPCGLTPQAMYGIMCTHHQAMCGIMCALFDFTFMCCAGVSVRIMQLPSGAGHHKPRRTKLKLLPHVPRTVPTALDALLSMRHYDLSVADPPRPARGHTQMLVGVGKVLVRARSEACAIGAELPRYLQDAARCVGIGWIRLGIEAVCMRCQGVCVCVCVSLRWVWRMTDTGRHCFFSLQYQQHLHLIFHPVPKPQRVRGTGINKTSMQTAFGPALKKTVEDIQSLSCLQQYLSSLVHVGRVRYKFDLCDIDIFIHTYIHTYIHACMHTHIHAYIHT